MRPETRKSVQAIVFAGKWQWYQSRHNPFPPPDKRNWLAQYQHIREHVLAGEWDAVLLVEHDMEIPPDTLQKLWDTGAQVAYGVYLLRHGANVVNAFEYVKPGVVGESLSFYPTKYAKAFRDGVVKVSGIAFGCTLIRREVLEQISFRLDANGAAPDTPFAIDCSTAGVSQVAHFGVLCGHWYEGRMIYPMQDDREPTQLVKAIQSANIRVYGQSVRIEAGKEYHLPLAQVSDLERTGYVQRLEQPKERKGRVILASGNKDIQPTPANAPAKSIKPAKSNK